MPELDLILRGGMVVTPTAVERLDIGVASGQVAALAPDLKQPAGATVDAADLHIFPGLIDSHVHFNEPGRADWEGFMSGSHALVAGGGTMFFDMPLNSIPPTCSVRAVKEKLVAAEGKCHADFGLWGGLVPGNLDNLEGLAAQGVVGFKAFMSSSGVDEFEAVDDTTLREGMKRASKLKKLVAVHAESEEVTRQLTDRASKKGLTSVRDYLESRPIYAELDAIHRAIQLAGETKCALHLVHVSSGAGVALVASAQKQGVDVTCETCPHYLTLTEDDMEQLGAVAKCAPPLRTGSAQEVLWRYLENGFVSTIGSDHSPAPADLKQNFNFFKVWGGISSVQHTLPLLLTRGNVERGLALPIIAQLTSFNVAERFGLPKAKGRIEIGADADFALVDLSRKFSVQAGNLHYRHRQSPYVGRALTGPVVRTILRGVTVYSEGRLLAPAEGRFVPAGMLPG